MALQTTIDKVAFGQIIEIPDCYCKIVRVSGDKAGVTMIVEFSVSGARQFDKSYSFVPSVADGSDNFIKQGYEHLKTLDEFYGSIDV